MKKTYFICSDIQNPYFNIASEEYLLKQTDEFYIYLWRNKKAVIVGNNQNTLLEVNLNCAQNNDVKIVRRLTGGGTVYHDENNICYTIIAPYKAGENAYIKFTAPVIEYLNSLGVKAEFSGRNDICVDGKKISGNAQVVYKDRIMHHGCILFDSDLTALSNVLVENKLKTQSKGIKSIRARVTNVRQYLNNDMSADDFFHGLASYLKRDLTEKPFIEQDKLKINELVKDKYSTYEWNIGKSPKGSSRLDVRFSFGTLTLTFDLNGGIIENAEIFGDFFASQSIDELANKLNGIRFTKDEILNALLGIETIIQGASATEIVDNLF